MRPTICWLTILPWLWCSAVALGQDEPALEPHEISWRESLGRALAEAREQKLPVFVALLADSEPSCRKITENHYTDPSLVTLLEKLPCVVAAPDAHEPVDRDGRMVCARYGTVTCAQHREADKAVRGLLFPNHTPIIPQHLLLSSNGEILDSRPFYVPPISLRRWLVRTLKRTHPDLVPADALDERSESMVDSSLFDQLQLGNGSQRQRAAATLDALDADGVGRALETYMGPLDAKTRERLLAHMADSGMNNAAFLLARYLNSDDAELRRDAADGFGRIGTVQPLGALLARLQIETNVEVRLALLTAIGRCSGKQASAQTAVVAATSDRDARVKIAALLALGDLTANGEVTSILLSSLDTNDAMLASAAVWSCGRLRVKTAREPIERLMTKFPELSSDASARTRFKLLAELALKLIRGENVDDAFYCELRPRVEADAGR
jgi:hypothetical protein